MLRETCSEGRNRFVYIENVAHKENICDAWNLKFIYNETTIYSLYLNTENSLRYSAILLYKNTRGEWKVQMLRENGIRGLLQVL
jgi:hypothetical protein